MSAYLHITKKLLGKGVRLRITYTSRTFLEQDDLYQIGRTKLYDKKGKRIGIVTNAKGGQSIHNYHLAWDIVLLLDKDNNGTFETAVWNTVIDFDNDGIADWMEAVKHFESIGATWGGRWRFSDKPHFQMDFGHNWKSLKALYKKGETFQEIINGKTYTYVKLPT